MVSQDLIIFFFRAEILDLETIVKVLDLVSISFALPSVVKQHNSEKSPVARRISWKTIKFGLLH